MVYIHLWTATSHLEWVSFPPYGQIPLEYASLKCGTSLKCQIKGMSQKCKSPHDCCTIQTNKFKSLNSLLKIIVTNNLYLWGADESRETTTSAVYSVRLSPPLHTSQQLLSVLHALPAPCSVNCTLSCSCISCTQCTLPCRWTANSTLPYQLHSVHT